MTLTRYMRLTHLSRMNFPIPVGRTSLFQILGMLPDGIFSFLFIFFLKENYVSKQRRSGSALFAYAPQKEH